MKAITLLTLFGLITFTSPSFAAIGGGRNTGGNNGGDVIDDNNGNDGTVGGHVGRTNWRNQLSDQLFLRQSIQVALMEIAMGELALENSENATVQEFAEHLVQDHTAQLEQAQVLAGELGVTLSDSLATRDQNDVSRLSRLSGERFDRAWTQLMVSSHRNAFALHDRAAERARQENVRTYARAQLVPLATHLTQALALAEEIPTTAAGRNRRR